MDNPISNPTHYQFTSPCSEVRDVINDRLQILLESKYGQHTNILYDYSNSIKYLLRAFAKNGIEDLHKAKYVITCMISALEENDT